jgi:hypothetical protein
MTAVRVLVVTAAAAALLTTGCSASEKICGGGQYPVKAVGNATGRTCQDNGKEPPEGYVRYPDGKVPKYIDDEWDKYWRTKIVDKNGTIVN